MKKITEKWNLWVPKQYTDALFIVEKSTFAATVHSTNICGYCSFNEQ